MARKPSAPSKKNEKTLKKHDSEYEEIQMKIVRNGKVI